MSTTSPSDNAWQGLFFDPFKGKFHLVLAKDQKSKRLCCVKFCRNPRTVEVDSRGKITKQRTTCHRCRSRLYRANNAERYAYHHVKDSAKKRGIRFTLTFEQFLLVIKDTGYLSQRGRKRGCLQIDRIRSEAGYELGNLRVIEASHNNGKGILERHRKSLSPEQLEEDPF